MSTTADAPTFVPPSSRTGLGAVVPVEYLRPVRIALMFTYLAWYLVWLRWRGLTVDRVSVAMLVAAFLVCAFIGRTWRTWGVLLLDCVAYCVMWISYEATRGVADDGINFGLFRLKFPLQVETMRNIDRFLFFGHDPNWVLQRHFWGTRIRWYDVVACTTYMTHFVFPMIVMAALWATSHRQWARFMKRFATLLFVACLMFVVLPTVPPWMLGSRKFPYQVLPELHRNAGRGFYHIGFNSWSAGYKLALSNGNGVAAMPSLHASFALIVPAFFLPWIRPKWLKAVVLVFPAIMLTSLVYLGEHWVIDGLVGWAITGGCFLFWGRMERRGRAIRADRSLAALT